MDNNINENKRIEIAMPMPPNKEAKTYCPMTVSRNEKNVHLNNIKSLCLAYNS